MRPTIVRARPRQSTFAASTQNAEGRQLEHGHFPACLTASRQSSFHGRLKASRTQPGRYIAGGGGRIEMTWGHWNGVKSTWTPSSHNGQRLWSLSSPHTDGGSIWATCFGSSRGGANTIFQVCFDTYRFGLLRFRRRAFMWRHRDGILSALRRGPSS